MMSAELLQDTQCVIGESPTWSARERSLYWIDVKEPALHRLGPDGARRRWELGADVGAFALTDTPSEAVVALRTGVFRLDLDGGGTTLLAPPPFDPALFRFNEGICDAAGRFWVGVMFDPLPGHEAPPRPAPLHRFTLAEGLVPAPDGAELHNGAAWSADGRTLYMAHSNDGVVWRYAYDPDRGALGARTRYRHHHGGRRVAGRGGGGRGWLLLVRHTRGRRVASLRSGRAAARDRSVAGEPADDVRLHRCRPRDDGRHQRRREARSRTASRTAARRWLVPPASRRARHPSALHRALILPRAILPAM